MTREVFSIPKIWPGATVVVIAGGPSLSLGQIRHVARAHLEGKCKTIACNDAVFVAWWASWLHSPDSKWWHWNRLTAPKFPGQRTCCCEDIPPQWADFIPARPPANDGSRGGLTGQPNLLAGGGNSGYQAIEIAILAGAKKIYLLGIDMKPGDEGRSHWFGDHPDGIRSDYPGTMIPNFETLPPLLAARGVTVTNCSPDSALRCFPMAKIEDCL